jgi:hypothetical protein
MVKHTCSSVVPVLDCKKCGFDKMKFLLTGILQSAQNVDSMDTDSRAIRYSLQSISNAAEKSLEVLSKLQE